MKEIKIATILGARPQFIKASALSREISKNSKVEELIVHTGQHFDSNMSDIFFNQLKIPQPGYNLEIHGLNHGSMTGRMMEGIEKILLEYKPHFVIVYGDTNSTLAGSLVAKKLHIPLAHVEAGLRSYNLKMPEEINRILTDRISDVLFCPTAKAVANLNVEGFENYNCEILNTGDIMFDVALHYSKKAIKPNFKLPDTYILATIHREENTNSKEKLAEIIKGFEIIGQDTPLILPLHPRTKKMLKLFDITLNESVIYVINPVSYLEMVYLIKNCEIVVTDSGGLQKEAYFFQKNCVTIRNETEWVELVDAGYNVLSPVKKDKIIINIKEMLNRKKTFKESFYGNGDSSKKILNAILAYK